MSEANNGAGGIGLWRWGVIRAIRLIRVPLWLLFAFGRLGGD